MQESLRHQFLNPDETFSPIPFWFWNASLSEEEITRQLEDFSEKGVNGFVLHPRIGIPKEIPYLSDKFMYYVRHAVEEAARLHMKVVLYDEAMYPSGSAHGMVVEGDPQFASRALRLEVVPLLEMTPDEQDVFTIVTPLAQDERILSVQAGRQYADGAIIPGSIRELSVTDGQIRFAPEDPNVWVILILIEGYSHGTIRGIHAGEDDLEPFAPASGDLMNPKAVDKFIHLTYDRYYDVLKDYFGTTIIGMFTDEPCAEGRNHIEGIMPWTEGFLEWWEQCGGQVTDLPLLWLDTAESARLSATVRREYSKAINKRLGYAYYGKISEWCATHGIALTGHPQNSDDIGVLKYFQIPGQDLVWRWVAPEDGLALNGRDSTMAKCSADSARHLSKRRNGNECFGCCGNDRIEWALTADDMKWYLDWLFVRGVNLLYPHAFFYSIEGKLRYGERPPDVGPHNIWWEDYRLFSDYIKRMCWLMTDSVNTTAIAILCEEDHLPWGLAKECFQRQIEFNYLEDSLLLSDHCRAEDGFLKINAQNYRVLLIESPKQLTDELTNALKPFVKCGGKILCLTEDKTPEELINELVALANVDTGCRREVVLNTLHGIEKDIRISHVVKDNQDFYLLVNEGEDDYIGTVQITAKAFSHVQAASFCCAELWHPWEGQIEAAECTVADSIPSCLMISVTLNRRESVVIAPTKSEQINRFDVAEEIIPVPLEWQIHSIMPSANVQEALGVDTQPINQLNTEFSSAVFQLANHTNPLTSWTKWQTSEGFSMEHFSGKVEYHTTLMLSDILLRPNKSAVYKRRIYLDLGKVAEIARLWINDVPAGVKMWAPYVFDITDYLVEGGNQIRLTIQNCLANGINKTSRTSGLLGPIQLKIKEWRLSNEP